MRKKIKAMPWINVKNKGDADLYFEFLEPKERKEFFDDLTSTTEPTVTLPDFGKVIDYDITNPNVKQFSIKDIDKSSEEFIKRLVRDHAKVTHPFLDYDDKRHKFVLKPKYDIEKMIHDIVKKH